MVEAFDTWRNNKTANDYGDWFELEAPGTGGLLWSDVDIMEMVDTFKNSPAVIMWSIGNEIRGQTVADAQRLVADIKSIDTTRPVVWGSDSYRTPPSPTSTNGQIAQLLDGVGLNYNTAQSVDALHQLYPDTFFFESESSSSTSARGVYQWPDQLNTGEDYTPGQRLVSSYDNNMASWTMPGEYGLKKDRDRKFFTGEFLWSGFDYIGEPTPYDGQFPVKSAFFGAVDTAGLPQGPVLRLPEPVDHRADGPPGPDELDRPRARRDGHRLGLRQRGHRRALPQRAVARAPSGTTARRRRSAPAYLETTEPTGDDKTFPSGSYTSPNGSTGKLHLTWEVPFEPGELRAVATPWRRHRGHRRAAHRRRPAHRATDTRPRRHRRGRRVAVVRDRRGRRRPRCRRARGGQPHPVQRRAADRSPASTTAGRRARRTTRLAQRTAFNGKALAIVRSDERPGPITITATSDGLLPVTTTVFDVGAQGPRRMSVDPYPRTPVGVAPDLPDRVTLVRGDGTTSRERVTWSRITRDLIESDRPYEVRAPSRGHRVTAHVTPYRVSSVQTFTTTVPVGVRPYLPGTARVTFTDGVTDLAAVTWDPVHAESLTRPGSFTVRGTLAEHRLTTSLAVTVSDALDTGAESRTGRRAVGELQRHPADRTRGAEQRHPARDQRLVQPLHQGRDRAAARPTASPARPTGCP